MASGPDTDLPSYTSATSHPEYSISLDTKGRPWLSIFVRSRATTATTNPIFLQGDVIKGRVEIDLKSNEAIKSITLETLAGTTFVGQEEEFFLKVSQTMWAPSPGTPAKLTGKHSWPFEYTLPSEVRVVDPKTGVASMYPLPPNFSERASPSYIMYKLVVTVKRGIFKVNQVLTCNISYTPVIKGERPSALRELSYSENIPLLGPLGDPEGWKVFGPIHIKGTLFGVKEVAFDCTLAVATPLSAAVGSPIPLIITITTDDDQLRDTLNTDSIRLALTRSMDNSTEQLPDGAPRRSDNYFQENSGMGYFWLSSQETHPPDPKTKVMQGEMEIHRSLKPSFIFPRFTIEYSLDLLQFQTPGFVPTSNEPLLSIPVKIANRNPPGAVTPVSYAPPGYEKPKAVNYNMSVGLLENGNQRFVHYHGHN